MKKAVPEDFGITMEDYKEAKERLAHFSETQDRNKSNSLVWIVIFVSILGAVLIGIGTEWVIKFIPVIGEGLGPWVGVPCFFILLWILCEYFDNRENRKLDKELSKPIYQKVQLYENALERYQQRRKGYWKSLRGRNFEKALARLYSDTGYTVRITKGSGDEGVDLILWKDEKKIVVQCKGHKKPIGVSVIRDLYGAMMHFEANSAILACPAGFTIGVKKFATDKPIQLISATDLVEMVESFGNR